jgi:hypothetical protein
MLGSFLMDFKICNIRNAVTIVVEQHCSGIHFLHPGFWPFHPEMSIGCNIFETPAAEEQKLLENPVKIHSTLQE